MFVVRPIAPAWATALEQLKATEGAENPRSLGIKIHHAICRAGASWPDIYSKLGVELEDTSEAARGLEYLQKSLGRVHGACC